MYSDLIIYNTIGYLFKQGLQNKLHATSNSDKVFFKVGILMKDPKSPEGDKKMELYNLFGEGSDGFTLTCTTQAFKFLISKDNFSKLEEWQQRVVADFISKVLDV